MMSFRFPDEVFIFRVRIRVRVRVRARVNVRFNLKLAEIRLNTFSVKHAFGKVS